MKSIESSIFDKLTQALKPTYLEITNESPQHHVAEGAETHFKVIVVSSVFSGLSSVKRHQKIYAEVRAEMNVGLHAISLHTYSPEEWEKSGQIPKSPACRGGSQ